MTIQEHIRCVVSCYDHTKKAYVEICSPTESSILSASIKRQCCPDGGFEIGGCYSATLSMVVKLPGMGLYQVRGAKIVVETKYSTETSWHPMGTFWVTSATRTGEIFTLSAMDAVGWLDTSSYNEGSDSGSSAIGQALYDESQLNDGGTTGRTITGWLNRLVYHTNRFISAQTGVSNMLSWKSPSVYYNQWKWAKSSSGTWAQISETLWIYAFLDPGNDSSSPRELMKQLATLAAGFIYADTDGVLTLGQFEDSKITSPTQISMDEIENDSCDVADYVLYCYRIDSIVEEPAYSQWWWTGIEEGSVNYRIQIEGNLFLDWFAIGLNRDGNLDAITSLTMGIWVGAREPAIRPFSCTVHSDKRFYLGQRIQISYRNANETSTTNYISTITSIQWTFRSGVVLQCGGEDSRVMADCLKGSKGDLVRQEARIRSRALESRVKKLGG